MCSGFLYSKLAFEKFTCAYFFQPVLEIMQLPILLSSEQVTSTTGRINGKTLPDCKILNGVKTARRRRLKCNFVLNLVLIIASTTFHDLLRQRGMTQCEKSMLLLKMQKRHKTNFIPFISH